MKDIVIYGSGGMAREVVSLIEDINLATPTWNILGYLDDVKNGSGERINGYPIIGTGETLKELGGDVNLVIAVSSPPAKKVIYERTKGYGLTYPVLIHPSARISGTASIGEGSVVGIDCIVSVNVRLGRHVFLNMRTVVGHDAVLGDFTSCLVNSIIAGSTVINEEVLVGSGSIIMEKKVIGSRARISMGSVVNFDVKEGCVVMCRPSKSMYFGE